MHILKTNDFKIQLEAEVFEGESSFPLNTLLRVEVFSCDFSTSTTMDIDVKEFSQRLYGEYKNYL